MSKLTDLKLTCDSYPESRFSITRIEANVESGQVPLRKYTVHAVQEWERNAAATDYIPLETSVTLQGLGQTAVTGLITDTMYQATQSPELIAVFYL